MNERGDLAFPRQLVEWLLLKHALIVGQVLPDSLVHNEKSPVDKPDLLFGLFLEGRNFATGDLQIPKAAGRLHCRYGHNLLLLLMKGNRFIDVTVDQPVSIGHQKILFLNKPQSPFKPSAGHGRLSGIQKSDAPIFLIVLVMIFDLGPRAQAKSDVTGVPMIIAKVLFDDIAFVPEAEHEIFMAEMRISFHDVPQNRPLSDWHHRFRPEFRFLAQARAQTAAKNHYFHRGLLNSGFGNEKQQEFNPTQKNPEKFHFLLLSLSLLICHKLWLEGKTD